MSDLDTNSSIVLQSQINHMQRYIENQDLEIYKFAERMDQIDKLLKLQTDQIESLNERGLDSSSLSSDRPPHY